MKKRTSATAIGIALGLVCCSIAIGTQAQAASLTQHIAIPAYFSPSDAAGAAAWKTLATGSASLGIVVANPQSGPGQLSTDYANALSKTHAQGSKVLGYVDTGYFGFSADVRYVPGTNDSSSSAWLKQAEHDVDTWYSYYGASLDGIFFDDAENVCGPNNQYASLYTTLSSYVHKHAGAISVDNAGAGVQSCYASAADTIVTFEGSYGDYLSAAPEAWQLSSSNPDKFWNLVYDVPDTSAMTQTINKSKQNNVGYIYATNDTLQNNPWDTIPSYWSGELAAVGTSNPPSSPAVGAIASGMAGKCLDDYYNSSQLGTHVDLYECNLSAAQTWTVSSDNTVKINGLCLDVAGQSVANGAEVILYTCNGGDNQKWSQTADGSLLGKQSGKCLDDPNWSTNDNTDLDMWTCTSGANQKWRLP